jgi:hypothetical protein
MGVTVCILDDKKFSDLLDTIRDATAPAGYLLLTDTVTSEKEQTTIHPRGNATKYRTESNYIQQVIERGFTLIRNDILAQWTPTQTNRLMLFHKH